MRKIIYFGYGANSDLKMINALIGRIPFGFKAKLKDYCLFVQSLSEVPSEAKKILEKVWDENFKSYIAVPFNGKIVFGTAWEITQQERKIIGEWELHHKWYFPVNIKIIDENGNIFEAETEIIQKFSSEKLIEGEHYPAFLNDKDKMLKLAKKIRKDFLENNSENKK